MCALDIRLAEMSGILQQLSVHVWVLEKTVILNILELVINIPVQPLEYNKTNIVFVVLGLQL